MCAAQAQLPELLQQQQQPAQQLPLLWQQASRLLTAHLAPALPGQTLPGHARQLHTSPPAPERDAAGTQRLRPRAEGDMHWDAWMDQLKSSKRVRYGTAQDSTAQVQRRMSRQQLQQPTPGAWLEGTAGDREGAQAGAGKFRPRRPKELPLGFRPVDSRDWLLRQRHYGRTLARGKQQGAAADPQRRGQGGSSGQHRAAARSAPYAQAREQVLTQPPNADGTSVSSAAAAASLSGASTSASAADLPDFVFPRDAPGSRSATSVGHWVGDARPVPGSRGPQGPGHSTSAASAGQRNEPSTVDASWLEPAASSRAPASDPADSFAFSSAFQRPRVSMPVGELPQAPSAPRLSPEELALLMQLRACRSVRQLDALLLDGTRSRAWRNTTLLIRAATMLRELAGGAGEGKGRGRGAVWELRESEQPVVATLQQLMREVLVREGSSGRAARGLRSQQQQDHERERGPALSFTELTQSAQFCALAVHSMARMSAFDDFFLVRIAAASPCQQTIAPRILCRVLEARKAMHVWGAEFGSESSADSALPSATRGRCAAEKALPNVTA